MRIITKIHEWRLIRDQFIGQTIGFVPTMGYLHQGHLSLCQKAQAENDISIVSIFVNPTQFNQVEDFANYPRTLESDIDLLKANRVDYLLLPTESELYPDQYQIQLSENAISQKLEGQFRPGHFTGMLTIVLKLFHLVQPTRAYFGEKDYQQLLLIKKMVDALFLPIQIIGCETVRAEDGLALSSRNSHLSVEQRQHAAHFPRLLRSATPIEVIISQLQSLGFKVDYIVEKWQRRLGAVWLGDVRLIDNIKL